MSRLAPEEHGIRRERKRGRFSAALIFVGIASIVVIGVVAIYKKAEWDTRERMDAQIVSTGVPCELTSAAAPESRGAGFVLKAQCPDGIAHVSPSLSLWIRLVEALPSEKRIVKCAVRKDGKYTDCGKPEDLARRDDRQGRR